MIFSKIKLGTLSSFLFLSMHACKYILCTKDFSTQTQTLVKTLGLWKISGKKLKIIFSLSISD